jgi:phospholipase A2
MTAIRHERPWRDWVDKEHPFKEPIVDKKDHVEAEDAWFQWFELSPFEVGCHELEAQPGALVGLSRTANRQCSYQSSH